MKLFPSKYPSTKFLNPNFVPFFVSREEGRLDIWIGLMDTPPMTCSYCQTDNQPYYDIDKQDQVWRHLDFFEFKTYLHAPHPRVQCAHCQNGSIYYFLAE